MTAREISNMQEGPDQGAPYIASVLQDVAEFYLMYQGFSNAPMLPAILAQGIRRVVNSAIAGTPCPGVQIDLERADWSGQGTEPYVMLRLESVVLHVNLPEWRPKVGLDAAELWAQVNALWQTSVPVDDARQALKDSLRSYTLLGDYRSYAIELLDSAAPELDKAGGLLVNIAEPVNWTNPMPDHGVMKVRIEPRQAPEAVK